MVKPPVHTSPISIDGQISQVHFACDLAACRGACCTIPGGTGAPLLADEREQIKLAYEAIERFLPEAHRAVIEREGLVAGSLEAPVTPCYDDRACVYVMYESGIAKCAFEKAYLRGDISWRKPLSCHLFPLRADGGYDRRLRYEFIQECHPALRRGRSENIPLWQFLKDPLTRAYGSEWYDRLITACEQDHRPLNGDLLI